MDSDKPSFTRHDTDISEADSGKKSNGLTDQSEAGEDRLEDMRRMYKKILTEAEQIYQQNEKAFENIRNIRHKLMSARVLADLLEALVKELKFLNVDQITLPLDQDFISPGSDSIDNLPEETRQHLVFLDKPALSQLSDRDGKYRTFIGDSRTLDKLSLFRPDILSCVLLPLECRSLIGYLHLGSLSKTRFASDQSTDLLEDLAVTAALCFDNVITHEKNEQLATTDVLTGIHNRRYFYESAARAVDLANRYGDSVSCIYIDLNDFKPVNDTYGHDTGDLVLKKLARVIKDRVRRTDIFARLGGDEFALLLPRVNEQKAQMVVDFLRQTISEIRFAEEGFPDLRLSASFGAATTRPDECNLDLLMCRADDAMYIDKANKPDQNP